MDGWEMIVAFWVLAYFQGRYVSFREDNLHRIWKSSIAGPTDPRTARQHTLFAAKRNTSQTRSRRCVLRASVCYMISYSNHIMLYIYIRISFIFIISATLPHFTVQWLNTLSPHWVAAVATASGCFLGNSHRFHSLGFLRLETRRLPFLKRSVLKFLFQSLFHLILLFLQFFFSASLLERHLWKSHPQWVLEGMPWQHGRKFLRYPLQSWEHR